MGHHTIVPERRTLHGHFSPDLAPVLTIESGDTVRFETLDASWTIEPRFSEDTEAVKFEPREKGKDDGHALCGPVEVRGASVGDVLEVRIEEIRVGIWGWGGGGRGGGRGEKLGIPDGEECKLYWKLDADEGIGRSQDGHTVALRPFMGVMGMPPGESGVHSTGPPRNSGGNLDCKELVAGTTLFLPIPVDGALFSTGDGHAVQGDGEVSGVAIECPMEIVDLTFVVRKDMQIATPRARIDGGWLTMGLHEDLNEATMIALNSMLDLMCDEHSLERAEALALASLVVDLSITQIVNGTRGVHAFLPDDALKQ